MPHTPCAEKVFGALDAAAAAGQGAVVARLRQAALVRLSIQLIWGGEVSGEQRAAALNQQHGLDLAHG